MFSLALVVSFLALGVAAKPVAVHGPLVKLPLSKVIHGIGSHTLLQRDQARALALKNMANGSQGGGVFNLTVDNQAVTYVADIGIGTPPTSYKLLIDTGSSNTWIGAGKAYVKTNSSIPTADNVSVWYGSGQMTGTEYLDTVTLAPGLVVYNQSIGDATSSSGFDGVDGILGVGPTDLTRGSLSPDSSSTVPTVVDNAWNQGLITADKIGISIEPTTTNVSTGEITWGGVDPSKFNGTLNYAPITTSSPSSNYWGVDQSITYDTSTILNTGAGIVDTGTTLILLATDAYKAYVNATGATLDSDTGLLTITTANYANLKSLFFNINGVPYELTPNAQTWPRSLNTAIRGNAQSIYLVIADLGLLSDGGLNFINGYTFLERYYSVYDSANKAVGFAQTPYTFATTN
ncbi:hypothetical protein M378DRAFT_1014703 [Amanita muscaria Koide BX008]|uniref:Peptidase A1 domain-containing protein n=1 Tax=Amanita muscaria (strain Koide BX008) TaxID=946122 RepID=A0A0C2WR73_AMAMK|nr:hypothetical protein M378DRAFT_1014703 [Amanita muscaria Koide BX008]